MRTDFGRLETIVPQWFQVNFKYISAAVIRSFTGTQKQTRRAAAYAALLV